MLRRTTVALSLLSIAALTAGATPLPLPVNGDFSQGDLGWTLGGPFASIQNGRASLGYATGACVANLSPGPLGTLQAVEPIPMAQPAWLQFTYSVYSISAGSYLEVVAIPAVGPEVVLDRFNPVAWFCGQHSASTSGTRTVSLPALGPGAVAKLEFRVVSNGYHIHASLDNIALMV